MRAVIFVALLLGSSGCNSSQLRYTTLKVSRTIPDLQERQVLDNLARVAADPGKLPYYSVVNTGTVNISDTGSGGLSTLGLQHRMFPSASLSATANRSVTGNWTLNALVSPDRLRAMRAAYMVALEIGPIDPVDLKKLEEIEKAQSLPPIASGWLCVGGKHEVPREAHLVDHDGHSYVWVKPGHTKEFADFALLILNIATFTPSGPDSSKIHLSIDNLPAIQMNLPSLSRAIRPEALPAPLPTPTPAPSPPSMAPRLYEDSPTINRGLFFVPR